MLNRTHLSGAHRTGDSLCKEGLGAAEIGAGILLGFALDPGVALAPPETCAAQHVRIDRPPHRRRGYRGQAADSGYRFGLELRTVLSRPQTSCRLIHSAFVSVILLSGHGYAYEPGGSGG